MKTSLRVLAMLLVICLSAFIFACDEWWNKEDEPPPEPETILIETEPETTPTETNPETTPVDVPTFNVDFTNEWSFDGVYELTLINGVVAKDFDTVGTLFLSIESGRWSLNTQIADNDPLRWRGNRWDTFDVVTQTIEHDDATYVVKYPSRMRLTFEDGAKLNCKISGVEFNLERAWQKKVSFMSMELWVGEIIGERDALYWWNRK